MTVFINHNIQKEISGEIYIGYLRPYMTNVTVTAIKVDYNKLSSKNNNSNTHTKLKTHLSGHELLHSFYMGSGIGCRIAYMLLKGHWRVPRSFLDRVPSNRCESDSLCS